MAYPDKINALVDIAGTSTLSVVGHAARHNDVNDALDELKVVLTVPAANTLALAPGGTERLQIASDGTISGSGPSLGAWTAFTPTWTGITIGNGVTGGNYCQIGKVVHCRAYITFGSTTSVTAAVDMDFPVTAVSHTGNPHIGLARLLDASVGAYNAVTVYLSTTKVRVQRTFVSGATILMGELSSTSPFTWTTSDQIMLNFTYEAA
jgi:hypothetical protein